MRTFESCLRRLTRTSRNALLGFDLSSTGSAASTWARHRLRTHLPRWAAAIKLENFMVPACTPECHQVSTAALLDDASLATTPSSSVTVCHVPAGTRDRGCAEGVLPVVERLLASRVVRWEDAIIMNEGLHHSITVRPWVPEKDDQALRP